ncbi:MAG: lytic transglycosylase domain-containing protein [Kiritimatiellia bacterium]
MKTAPLILLLAAGAALALIARKKPADEYYGPPLPLDYTPPRDPLTWGKNPFTGMPLPSFTLFPKPAPAPSPPVFSPLPPIQFPALPMSNQPTPTPYSIIPSPARWLPPEAGPYLSAIQTAERANGIPGGLLARLLMQESGFKADIIQCRRSSHAGAMGIAQAMPTTAAGPGYGAPVLRDPCNPAEAIPWAGKYLAGLYRAFGAWDLALAAYNTGPGNVLKSRSGGGYWLQKLPTETQKYVADISRDVPIPRTA